MSKEGNENDISSTMFNLKLKRRLKNQMSSPSYTLFDCKKLLCDQIHERDEKRIQYFSDKKSNEETCWETYVWMIG